MNVEIGNEASILGIYVLNFQYSDNQKLSNHQLLGDRLFTHFLLFGKIFFNEKICQKDVLAAV
jgi:hypothetical protein